MCDQRPGRSSTRPAFTLMEMLVVISLILVVASLGLLLMPKINERQKVARGADQTQRVLFIVKNRALRDRQPRGVRIMVDPTTGYATRLIYIEQPDRFQGGMLQYDPTGMNPNIVIISGVDLTGGLPTQSLWQVQPGDFLQIQGGTTYRITQITPQSPTSAIVTTATPMWFLPAAGGYGPPLGSTQSTPSFEIIRAPRATAGEDPIQLTDSVIIDMRPAVTPSPPNPKWSQPDMTAAVLDPNSGMLTYDILFAPSGEIVPSPALTTATIPGKIILWVRDSSQDAAAPGDELLVTVYTRTGLIAAHPANLDPNVGGGERYFYTLDFRNSGL